MLLQYLSPTTVATATLAIIVTSRLHISSKNNQQICHQQLCSVSGICKSKYTDTIPQFFNGLYHLNTGLGYWLSVLGLVAVMYIAVAVIDTVRIFLWKRIEHNYLNNENR